MTAQSLWLISLADLRVKSSVAGNVKLGTWFGANVALKQTSASGEQAKALLAKQVSRRIKLSHPHVLPLYGVCLDSEPPILVYEDAVGTIEQYFRKGLNFDTFWSMFYQTVSALLFLEAHQTAHGNLKSSNILVGADGLAKLADFGFELTSKGLRSDSSMDVFSLGICIIQAWRGKDSAHEETVDGAVMPQRPAGMSDQGWKLVEKMCHEDPMRRLTLAEVYNILHELMNAEAITRASHDDRMCRICNALGSCADKFCASCGHDTQVTPEQTAASRYGELKDAQPRDTAPVSLSQAHGRQAFGSSVYAH